MQDEDGRWLGRGEAARRLLRWVERAAPLDATVLLVGETGTGKGLLARSLHQASRPARPFLHVDLAALAPGLLESELFGHERGAFTGAHGSREGRLEAAGDGTLFLDEIGELSLAGQARLLRVLEDRCFERVGSTRSRTLRARIVAATHVDLAAAVERGRFRRDLLHRLDVLSVRVPPLRERPEDLPLLVEDALARWAARCGEPPRTATPALLARLAERSWPGNVRELHNLLLRLLLGGGNGPLGLADLARVEALSRAAPAGPPEPGAAPADGAERVARALRATGGNVSRAARRLGLSRSALRRRIQAAGLEHMIPRD